MKIRINVTTSCITAKAISRRRMVVVVWLLTVLVIYRDVSPQLLEMFMQ